MDAAQREMVVSGNEAKGSSASRAPQEANRRKGGLVNRLASVHLLLWLVAILAAAMAVATVVPQKAPAEVYNHALGHLIGPLVYRSTLRDVYGAWWFIGGFGLVALSLLACSVRRAGQLLRGRGSATHVSRRDVAARPNRSEWRIAMEAGEAASALTKGLQKAGYLVQPAKADQKKSRGLTARRGPAMAWGVVIMHVGMALVLLGAAYGRLPRNSYSAVADLDAGESYEVQAGGDTFSVRLLDAGQERDEEGRPTRFWAEAEIIEDGEVVKSGLIEPNRPLRHRGVNTVLQSLSSAGYVVEVSKGEARSAVPVVFGPDGSVAMLETVRQLADPPWVVFIHDFRSSAGGDDAAPAAQVFADPTGQLSHNWEQVGWVGTEGLTYSDVRFRLVPGGQAAQLLLDRDIGVPLVWFGFCIFVLGSAPLIGIRRRTLLAVVSARGDACSVLFGGSDARAEGDFERAVGDLGVKATKIGGAAATSDHE